MNEQWHSRLPSTRQYILLVSARQSAAVTTLPAAKPAPGMSPFIKGLLKHSGCIRIPLILLLK